jgi:hypothetical protein
MNHRLFLLPVIPACAATVAQTIFLTVSRRLNSCAAIVAAVAALLLVLSVSKGATGG